MPARVRSTICLLAGVTLSVSGCGADDDDRSEPSPPSIVDVTGSSQPVTSETPIEPVPSDDSAIESGASDSERWDVVGVTDGDTIRVVGDAGEQRVRLIGINTPEVGECFAQEATDALNFVIGSRQVRLIRDVSDTDQFGRLLRFVELDDGTDVGAELVGAGFAVSRRYEPDVSRGGLYDELQAAARSAELGQWAPAACGAATVSGDLGDARIGVDIEYDAPGDDNYNLNAEWVRFTNDGSNELDLSGWELADESASHRYRFSDLVLASGASVTVFTGCGTDSATERFWCNESSAVWNNSGDTVFLRDGSGNIVVAETYRD